MDFSLCRGVLAFPRLCSGLCECTKSNLELLLCDIKGTAHLKERALDWPRPMYILFFFTVSLSLSVLSLFALHFVFMS